MRSWQGRSADQLVPARSRSFALVMVSAFCWFLASAERQQRAERPDVGMTCFTATDTAQSAT
jgi:hypothetical protein